MRGNTADVSCRVPQVHMEVIEIYMEEIRDLLSPLGKAKDMGDKSFWGS